VWVDKDDDAFAFATWLKSNKKNLARNNKKKQPKTIAIHVERLRAGLRYETRRYNC
jgi:hypothetical protein